MKSNDEGEEENNFKQLIKDSTVNNELSLFNIEKTQVKNFFAKAFADIKIEDEYDEVFALSPNYAHKQEVFITDDRKKSMHETNSNRTMNMITSPLKKQAGTVLSKSAKFVTAHFNTDDSLIDLMNNTNEFNNQVSNNSFIGNRPAIKEIDASPIRLKKINRVTTSNLPRGNEFMEENEVNKNNSHNLNSC